jgi:hypothetical protein
MSTDSGVVAGGGPVTRAQRAAAAGGSGGASTNPTPSSVDLSVPSLRPLGRSPVTVISPDSDESSELYDSDATESEAELPPSSYIDEETRLRQEESRLDEQLRDLQTQAMRRRVAAKQQHLLAVQAELEMGELVVPPVVAAPVVAALPAVLSQVVIQTPARLPYNLRPRMLAFQSSVGRKPPTAASLLYKAAVDGLPDAGPSAAVVSSPLKLDEKKVAAASAVPWKEKPARVLVKPVQPEKFTGENATQNERVDRWIAAVNSWLRRAEIPMDQELDWARSLVADTSVASDWLGQKDDELAHLGKLMTWEWLQNQLIQHYGQPSGALAMAAEWEVLRMGVKNADGSEIGGKSTRTVAAYSALFLHYMRALTTHSVLTEDLLVINRYVGGIRIGYDALYKVILGVHKVLWYDTLQEAIEAAYQAEAAMAVSRIDYRSAAGSSAPSSSAGNRFRGKRQSNDSLNNVEGEVSEEGEGETKPADKTESQSTAKVYGFRFVPGPDDGRFPLTEVMARMLYKEGRCYRCHLKHPVGPNAGRCTRTPATTAPVPLK